MRRNGSWIAGESVRGRDPQWLGSGCRTGAVRMRPGRPSLRAGSARRCPRWRGTFRNISPCQRERFDAYSPSDKENSSQ